MESAGSVLSLRAPVELVKSTVPARRVWAEAKEIAVNRRLAAAMKGGSRRIGVREEEGNV